jgi:hypothetical protein
MKSFVFLILLLAFTAVGAIAEDLDGRTAFLSAPGRDIGAALKRADTEHKRVLVFISNPARKHGSHINGTMGAPETKKMVKENFIVVIVPNSTDKHVAGLVDDVNPVHPAYVVFKPDGTVVEKGDAAMGAGNGYNWMQKLVATP